MNRTREQQPKCETELDIFKTIEYAIGKLWCCDGFRCPDNNNMRILWVPAMKITTLITLYRERQPKKIIVSAHFPFSFN